MTKHRSQSVAVLAALGFSLLAACTGKADGAATDTSAMAMTPTTGAPAAGASTSGAPSGAPALSDPNIVYLLDQAHVSDSVRGRLAETKGTNADVKSFARLMTGEHHAMRAAGQQLAKKLGVTPQAPAGDQSEAQAKQEMDSLNAMPKGAAWDRAYLDYEIGFHQQVLQTATAALGMTQNQELKDLIQKAAPIVQHHLDRAQEIRKKLGATT